MGDVYGGVTSAVGVIGKFEEVNGDGDGDGDGPDGDGRSPEVEMEAFSGPHGTGVGPVGLAPGQAKAAIHTHTTAVR